MIAMPSAPSRTIRETVELGRRAGLKQIKILPGIYAIVTGHVRLADIREVQVEDLLGREPVRIDVREIESYLKDKKVLVTGASGSIGMELCRQIMRFGPKRLIALDQDETGLFNLGFTILDFGFESMRSIARGSDPEIRGPRMVPIVGDVRDRAKIERVFEENRPDVVFHAAAYKHVPMMELHPDEAVKNNVFGTLVVAEAARRWGSEKFVFISTDKAVNPRSVMGATKRVAEMLVQSLNGRGRTKFVAVRFGNVLDSRGNVISVFREQIRRGGPVTVTHEDMRRYFMMASEAVLLVLQAGVMGEGGEVFVLDMGEPVNIMDLAKEMIRLSGYEPDKDIPIVITGPRPGEKISEELLGSEEGTMATKHEKIFVARMKDRVSEEMLRMGLKKLKDAAERNDRGEILGLLKELVPTYETDG